MGATVRGHSHPGPQGEPKAPRDETRRTGAASSLQGCNKWQTKLHTELDATSQAMEMITDAPSSREMEHRMSTLQTSLGVVERAIMRYEDLIEDCRMQEEEAR